jgi:hypothetical protein
MNWNEIRKRARDAGVNTRSRKKAELIRAIQIAEGNFDCYGRSDGSCDRWDCLWRDQCLGQVRRSA